jgi:hypothetical protein
LDCTSVNELDISRNSERFEVGKSKSLRLDSFEVGDVGERDPAEMFAVKNTEPTEFQPLRRPLRMTFHGPATSFGVKANAHVERRTMSLCL